MTATLTPPTATKAVEEKKIKTYVRYLRIAMEQEQALEWDNLTRDEVDELSAPYRDNVLADFKNLLDEKAERVVAQNELLAAIPEDVRAKAQKLGLVLQLTAG